MLPHRRSVTGPKLRRLSLTAWFTTLLMLCLLLPFALAAEAPVIQRAPLPEVTSPVGPPFECDQVLVQAVDSSPQLLQTRFDWREQGVTTAMQDQGSCGSCYAFATLANFESLLIREGAGTHDFAENHLKECVWRAQNGMGASCGSGTFYESADWLAQTGTIAESCNPYVASDVTCSTGGCNYGYTVLDWRMIAGATPPSVNVLKQYLQNYGPLFVAMYSGNSDPWANVMSNYDGSYTLSYGGTQTPNHAVTLIGWDDTLTHAGGTGGWIVKNSWGSSWGGTCGYGTEGGYFTIAYGSCSIGSYASYISEWQPYDSSGALYGHNDAGWVQDYGYNASTAWGLARFTAASDTQIQRIEFVTSEDGATVDLFIYDSFDPMHKMVGTLLYSRQNLTYDEAGYHSHLLSTPLDWTGGDEMVVVIKATNPSYGYPLGADTYSAASIGTTYTSNDGSDGSWSDLGLTQSASACLRLRVSTAGAVTETPTATATQYATNTPTPTATATQHATNTPTPTGTGSATRTPTATATSLPATRTATATATATSLPGLTRTPTPTATTGVPLCSIMVPPHDDGVAESFLAGMTGAVTAVRYDLSYPSTLCQVRYFLKGAMQPMRFMVWDSSWNTLISEIDTPWVPTPVVGGWYRWRLPHDVEVPAGTVYVGFVCISDYLTEGGPSIGYDRSDPDGMTYLDISPPVAATDGDAMITLHLRAREPRPDLFLPLVLRRYP